MVCCTVSNPCPRIVGHTDVPLGCAAFIITGLKMGQAIGPNVGQAIGPNVGLEMGVHMVVNSGSARVL